MIRTDTLVQHAAWMILAQGEQDYLAKSMAKERAAYGNYHEPETAGEYLWWIQDEATIQEVQSRDEHDPEAALTACQYALALNHVVLQLTRLGIEGVPPTKDEV